MSYSESTAFIPPPPAPPAPAAKPPSETSRLLLHLLGLLIVPYLQLPYMWLRRRFDNGARIAFTIVGVLYMLTIFGPTRLSRERDRATVAPEPVSVATSATSERTGPVVESGGPAIQGSSIETHIATATEDKVVADRLNQRLSEVAIGKDLENGTLTIRFNLDPSFQCPSCRFLVRLFDKNGNHITNFQTEEFLALFYRAGQWQVPSPVQLQYPVNIRDLRDTERAEFGVVMFER